PGRAGRQVGPAVAVPPGHGRREADGGRPHPHVRQRGAGVVTANSLIFDCDGVLADTERFGHLPAFNQTFEEAGLPVTWSEAEYARLVLIGGGKERMASLLTDDFVRANGLPADAEGQAATIAAWHKRKTAIFK